MNVGSSEPFFKTETESFHDEDNGNALFYLFDKNKDFLGFFILPEVGWLIFKGFNSRRWRFYLNDKAYNIEVNNSLPIITSERFTQVVWVWDWSFRILMSAAFEWLQCPQTVCYTSDPSLRP